MFNIKENWYYIVLLVFSVVILSLEFNYGQDYVRHYLTDIEGPVLFFGLQTTITTILLVIISYNFALAFRYAKVTSEAPKHMRFFFLSQILVFMYLAVDERFMFHERIAYILGIHDALFLFSIAVGQLVVFLYFWRYCKTLIYWNSPLVLGALCFVAMLFIDAFGAEDARMRLSSEDLFKLWAIFFFFRYSFKVYNDWVKPQKSLLKH